MDRHLSTPRLQLRPPQPGDAPAAHARWSGDAQVLRHLGWPVQAREADTAALLDWDHARWTKHSAWTWLLVLRPEAAPAADHQPIGLVQLLPQQTQDGRRAHHLRLGYLLGRAWQGQGLMREAVQAVTRHALAQSAVWRVDAVCDVDNAPSNRLLQALGYTCEGRLARHSRHPQHGGPPRDVWLWACCRD